jgi:hypothetical protein
VVVAQITLNVEGGNTIAVPTTALLVWLDETGHEFLLDKNNPFFGLGGCVIEARKYNSKMRKPWADMKTRLFSGVSQLHAADLRKPTPPQLVGLSHIFEKGEFKRIAAVVTDQTNLANGIKPYEATALCLIERLRKVSNDMSFDEIYLIMESSKRGDKFAERYLVNHPFKKQWGGGVIDVKFNYFFMPKSANEPGMEVADFIMHSVSGRTRARLNGENAPKRKDFNVTFPGSKPNLQSFLEIDMVKINDT